MNCGFQFSNLLGSVYRKGNILFTSDGNSVISPVGNKISIFDLKNNTSSTLAIEARFNLTCLSLAADGFLMIAVDEEGEGLLISLFSRTVLHRHRFNKVIHDIKFSPDKRYFAVTKDDIVFLYKTPGSQNKEFNPFSLERIFKGAFDDTVCLDWTSDSRVLAVGSKDMSTRIYAVDKFSNLSVYCLGGHSDSIVGCFFEENSLNLYTVSRNGQICIWQCSTKLRDLIPWTPASYSKPKIVEKDEVEDDDMEKKVEVIEPTSEDSKEKNKFFYKKLARHYASDAVKQNGPSILTATAYHRKTHILVTGFSNGAFLLHEMPDFNLIHSLSLEDQFISSIAFNVTGDWIAIGCQGLGQLIVWEWQSESFIMKQQGHFHNMNALAYSMDGQLIATGGDDCKVKLWNVDSGFCFVTFTQHQASISGITFSINGKLVVSSSLDGTVRAYNLNSYRNFKTFTSPRPTQFSCVALDASGDIVCAGAQDVFEIFVWSMQNGRLLEILSGHEGPVSSLAFSSRQALLASASWDKTVQLWDVFESKGHRETINVNSDALCVAFRPDGQELAVATLDANITFFSIPSAVQTGSIEGRNDLGSGRKDTDLVTAKKVLQGKTFTTLNYSADGEYILAAGQAKNVCLYKIKEQLLVKKFEISKNHSLDGIDDMINRRKMTEFGNVALVEERDDENSPVAIRLPGVKKGDMASRSFKPEVRVTCVAFSPTGRAWSASTTEGLLIYSLDAKYVFDPMDLEMNITPTNIRQTLVNKEYSSALLRACKLNEKDIIKEVLEKIPIDNIKLICSNLPTKYVEALLRFLGIHFDSTRHVEFYLLWVQCLLMNHGKHMSSNSMEVKTLLQLLHRSINQKYKDLRAVCEHNKYSSAYILALGEQKRKIMNSIDDDDDEQILVQ